MGNATSITTGSHQNHVVSKSRRIQNVLLTHPLRISEVFLMTRFLGSTPSHDLNLLERGIGVALEANRDLVALGKGVQVMPLVIPTVVIPGMIGRGTTNQ
jgi:hypothetical protein